MIPFSLKTDHGTVLTPDDLQGRYTILYFYPRDNTPGCTLEGQEFSALKEEFSRLETDVYGVSADSVEKHCSFIEKQGLTIPLISDPEKELISAFGAWKKKNMFGREYMGIVRTTVMLSPENKEIKRWDRVKARGHAEKVLAYLKELSQ
ncbi:peroxiredoxin [Chitinivibrio alkaliphilus]|uniref:thioredoxin-dependent peroxiredoxin n=1 Tax=Chitinivibrio alkaliphilus ACht1 TaxID=1313304 RepID=U7D6Y9_9BACT|nr:peroxiredoxin [Chitinivibrio alkaliphilus]ERP30832.1 Peroxiredoxin [Chitinivibrio alkaliphilus ACht1]